MADQKLTSGFVINNEVIGISYAESATYDSSGNNIADTLTNKLDAPNSSEWSTSDIYGLKKDGSWGKVEGDEEYITITDDNIVTLTEDTITKIDNAVSGINNTMLGQPLAIMAVQSDAEIVEYCTAGAPVGTIFFRVTNS